jgi:toxin-antitoxin system PIN domain toxin
MFLPDINLWLALSFNSHTHHAAANAWFQGRGRRQCFFCRWTQQGFLRLATNPQVFKRDAVKLKDAWRLYDQILRDPQIGFADEPADLEVHWRAYTQRRSFSPKVWGDAYLAAFAKAASLEVVTFDKGFGHYKKLACTILP